MQELTSPSPDCRICAALWRAFTAAGDAMLHYFNFSYVEAMEQSGCSQHMPLIQLIADQIEANNGRDQDSTPAKKMKKLFIWVEPPYRKGVEPTVRLSRGARAPGDISPITWSLVLVRKEDDPGHPGLGRICDPDWVDVNMAKAWKNDCLQNHGERCRNPLRIWPVKPAWLVDTMQYCVVPGSQAEVYIALSYMWGDTQPVIRDSDTMKGLQEPNALKSGPIQLRLSAIHRDVIELTRVLGERYLWIDALCIDHTDQQGTANELRQMGSIYANALLTIVAAHTDAEAGIPGLPGISRSRRSTKRPSKLIPWANETIMVPVENMTSFEGSLDPSDTGYHSRGWTHQEFLLAQRRLIFDKSGLSWQCSRGILHEDLKPWVDSESLALGSTRPSLHYFHSLNFLTETMGLYNQRSFTYDDDALAGISGLLAVASRYFPGGFLYGLAEVQFEWALCWMPADSERGHWGVKRRKPSGRPTDQLTLLSALPSWSWVGWKGSVHYRENSDNAGLSRGSFRTITPVYEWYTGASPDCSPPERRRILSDWYRQRDIYKDAATLPPLEWTRHCVADLPSERRDHILFPDGFDKYYYKHPRFPGKEFYFPPPIYDIDESSQPDLPEQTPYLFCQTHRIQLWGQVMDDKHPLGVKLRDSFGIEVGELWLHHPDDVQLFSAQGLDDRLGLEVDLVAICKHHDYSRHIDESTFQKCIRKSDWIAVMWVEEQEGVCYRRGIGKVSEVHWTNLSKEDFSLILG